MSDEKRAGYVITYIPIFETVPVETVPIYSQETMVTVMRDLIVDAEAVVLHVRFETGE